MSEPECRVTVTRETRGWRWYLNPNPVPSFPYKYMGFTSTRWGAERAGKRAARRVVKDIKRGKSGVIIVR